MNRVITTAVVAIVLSGVLSAQAQNTVTFDNQSGEPALVKLIGPTSKEIEVPSGTKQSVKAFAGLYTIKVRYGTPSNYRYGKGEQFEVKQTATTKSAITITLHKVVAGNYKSRPITEAEFTAETGQTTPPVPSSITVDGVTYENVKWGALTPTTISFRHSGGAATIPLSKLPPELQQRFGCAPKNVAEPKTVQTPTNPELKNQVSEAIDFCSSANMVKIADLADLKALQAFSITFNIAMNQKNDDAHKKAFTEALDNITKVMLDSTIALTKEKEDPKLRTLLAILLPYERYMNKDGVFQRQAFNSALKSVTAEMLQKTEKLLACEKGATEALGSLLVSASFFVSEGGQLNKDAFLAALDAITADRIKEEMGKMKEPSAKAAFESLLKQKH